MDVLADTNWELELNEYIRQGEPDKVDKSNDWQNGIHATTKFLEL